MTALVRYTNIDRAINMVEAVNNAKNEREHRDARLRLEGYMIRCDEHGERWPAVELDLHFGDGNGRPTCAGVFLDWKEQMENEK